MTLTDALDLLDGNICTPGCLLAADPPTTCTCRCQATHHGALRLTAPTTGRTYRTDTLADTPLTPHSLVGSFFHSDHTRGWQGVVVAEPHPGTYLVETFSWLIPDSVSQKLVHLDDMHDWSFYDDAKWLSANSDSMQARWERQRQDPPVTPPPLNTA
jgi:hypothetical protein